MRAWLRLAAHQSSWTPPTLRYGVCRDCWCAPAASERASIRSCAPNSAAEVVAEFKELSRDAETEEFLASCTQQGWVQSMATALLRLVYSLTDTNAILNRACKRCACMRRPLPRRASAPLKCGAAYRWANVCPVACTCAPAVTERARW